MSAAPLRWFRPKRSDARAKQTDVGSQVGLDVGVDLGVDVGLDAVVADLPDRRVFRSDELEDLFRRQGFVTVQLFDAERNSDLLERYLSLGDVPDDGSGDQHELHHRDFDRKHAVQTLLHERLDAVVEDLLDGYRARMVAFIRKPSGQGPECEPHVDPSFVDETTSRSVMIWCTLSGVGPGDGLMYLIPGSNSVGPRIRAHMDPRNSFCELEDAILDGFAVPVSLDPGWAVIFDHSTVHYVEPNTSGTTKVIAQAACTVADEPMIYVSGDGAGRARRYDVDPDFFLSFPLHLHPSAELLERYEPSREVALSASDKPGIEALRSADPRRDRGAD